MIATINRFISSRVENTLHASTNAGRTVFFMISLRDIDRETFATINIRNI